MRHRSPYLPLALVFAGLLASCDGTAPRKTEADKYDAANFGYVKAPEVTSVAVTSAGELLVTGSALAQARVRFSGAGEQAYGVTSGSDGRFQASLPQAPGGSVYDLSMEAGGRLMKGEGRLFVPPATDPAVPPKSVLLRTGSASLPLWPQAGLLAVADYDGGGVLAISGRAQAGDMVDIEIDRQPMAEARAGEDGVYVAVMPLQGGFGSRTLNVSARARDHYETRQIVLRPPQGERAATVGGTWYIDWLVAGGAMQTTVVF